MIQYTITIGEIVSALSLLCGVAAALIAIKLDVRELKTMVRPMWAWWTKNIEERHKSDDEIEHEIRASQQVLALREEMRRRL